MRLPFAIIGLLTLCACSAPIAPSISDQQSSSIASESSSIAMVIVDTGAWLRYQSDALDVSFIYPPFYSVQPEEQSTITFYRGDTPVEVSIEGVHARDGIPEGEGIHVYRTRDAAILESLENEYIHYIGTKVFNGVEYREYTYDGMAQPYQYIAPKNGYFYVLNSTWGPNNPVTEEIMRSLRITE